jgi:tryptophan synthase alpha chain
LSEIAAAFERCSLERRAAFIPYLTAGDPDFETSGLLLKALAVGGADIIELGVPFSDPIADGPVNQRAATRAIEAGATLSGILDLVARHRNELHVPIVLFTYYNPILAAGVERFAERAKASGVDGVLCVDLPPEEASGELVPALRAHDIDSIFLLAPTSDKRRVKQAAAISTGFVYYVSRTGVTGAREALPVPLIKEVRRLRRRLAQPLAVGFGISTPAQVKALARVADGVVVGSALVRIVEENQGDPALPDMVEAEVRRLAGALR